MSLTHLRLLSSKLCIVCVRLSLVRDGFLRLYLNAESGTELNFTSKYSRTIAKTKKNLQNSKSNKTR